MYIYVSKFFIRLSDSISSSSFDLINGLTFFFFTRLKQSRSGSLMMSRINRPYLLLVTKYSSIFKFPLFSETLL